MGLEGLVTVEKIRAAINASLSGLSNSNATIAITKNDGTTSTITINNVANATTATKLATARTINGVAFDGTKDITIDIPNPVIASEAEAKAGTNNTKFMTPLRVKQAIDALAANNGGIASANLAQNGYVKFANGLILQWGYNQANLREESISTTIAFPITYSNAAFSVVGIPTAHLGVDDLPAYSMTAVTKYNFTVIGDALSSGVTSSYIFWISIGH